MPKQIVIAEQHRIAAVFSEESVQELIVAKGSHQVSDIYLGVVENVLPGIDAAFVNIGDSERNGFIHVSDLGPLRRRRSAGSITELLAPQQKVLVQIMKEPTGNKGPRLTGKVTLPGRYLVLLPYGQGVNLSRRIDKENERHRLRALAILIKPAGMGLLVRTEAEGVPEEAIMEDLENLQRQWEEIQQDAKGTRAPALLNRDDDFVQRVLRDAYNADVNRIVVDSHTGMKRVKLQLSSWSAGSRATPSVLVDHHRERTPLLEYFRVNSAIREALKPRADLPSGGYIIIEPTEALTVIDVNSGSFTRSATARETVLWTNCEAAVEIAHQLKLRNLAGVIVVDFIDMESHRDRMQVLEHFQKALKPDKARPQIAELSELGLVELTRKRQGQNIYELFGRACPTCGGLGHLVQLPDDDGQPVTLLPGAVEDGDAPGVPQLQRSQSSSNGASSRGGRRGGSRSRGSNPVSIPAPARLDPAAEGDQGDDLELVNHPNYQEASTESNNRRRRRRRGEAEEGSSSSRRGRSSSSSDSSAERSKPTPAPIPASKKSPEPSPADGASDGESSTGRDRPSRDRRRTVTPPERVVVTMTEEEQEVFAWMGVPPVVLSKTPVERPKTAIVAVVLPGEDPPADFLPTESASDGASSDEASDGATGSEAETIIEVTAGDSSSDAGDGDSSAEDKPRSRSRSRSGSAPTTQSRGRGGSRSGSRSRRGGTTQVNGTPQRRSTAQPLPADTVSPEEMAKILGQPVPEGADAPVLALAQGRAEATTDDGSSEGAAEPVAAGESSSGRSRRRRRRSSSE
ncbi:MAG: Rne/Rng family ribonuclease [Cyanobacteria bacterium P01_H01_bin.130]